MFFLTRFENMKKISIFIVMFLHFSSVSFAQVSINTDGAQSNQSAGLDVKFNNKGFLLPRLSQSQILTISNPANGLQVFCTTDSKMYIFVATDNLWKEVAYGTGTIVPPFSCGNLITINHAAGAVAPVTKTVIYGTVTNIPGELSKCWITSNLGADHQATAVNDATEASAGWYWQFNRQQGYKYDNLTRTPNTTWITYINENLDWQTANDPCTLELGADWRIPTYTEWTNVDASGNWTNWIGPWYSALKMHAAGTLYEGNGALYTRGSNGNYWSSTQSSASNGWYLAFHSDYSFINNYYKADGFPLRCLRD